MKKGTASIDVQGKRVDWDVDPSDGTFFATLNGEKFMAPSLKALTDKLRAQSKKAPLDIPFVQFESRWYADKPEVKHGVVVGIHSGNGNLIVRYDHDGRGDKQQHSGGRLLRGDVDTKKLQALWDARVAAQKAYDDFIEDNELEIPKGDA